MTESIQAIPIDDPDSEFTTEKAYVLVIYTGGTIGMKETPDGKCVS